MSGTPTDGGVMIWDLGFGIYLGFGIWDLTDFNLEMIVKIDQPAFRNTDQGHITI
jgi:hypothetical protein